MTLYYIINQNINETDHTLICNPVTYPMANPKVPPITINVQKCKLERDSKFTITDISPKSSIKGKNNRTAFTLLQYVSFHMLPSIAGNTFFINTENKETKKLARTPQITPEIDNEPEKENGNNKKIIILTTKFF